jgi:ferredoxin
MAQTKKIQVSNLPRLFEEMKKAGKTIIAPRQKGSKVYFAPVQSYDQVADKYIQTVLSAKSVVFPRVEELFSFVIDEKNISQNDNHVQISDIVVFGMRPCDAASFEYLKAFFLNENPDFHFKRRLDKTTFITLSCREADEFCFCTSVGLGPGSTKGSDMVLTDMGNGSMYVESMTDKGNAIISLGSSLFENSETVNKEPFLAKLPTRFDLNKVEKNVENIYQNPKWKEDSFACLACGACAFSCPTCTCFDIQDEMNGNEGRRLRLWDTCGQPLFTLHASGHNPRHVQSERWRHRILHKFRYSVQNLDMVSCVGCGRCVRACPGGMNIIEQITFIAEA